MTECEYENDGKYIVSPGKFEGEPRYVPYLWDQYLNGITDYDDDDGTLSFSIMAEDRKRFPELAGIETVMVWEDDIGFVHSRSYAKGER